ncbi:MAG: hypothetical protein IJ514_03890 [Clostridia bacterium]|nr:hypothetical protein [Clostridia bacterium]
MNIFKKFLAVALSLCLMGGAATALTACKEEETPPPPVETQKVDFTVTVKSDGGTPIEGAQFVMYANIDNSKVGDLVTNAEGKATVNVAVGEYDLELDSASLPAMHFPDQYTWTLDITETANTLEVIAEDISPNGSLERPYYFTVNEDNELSAHNVLAVDATVYFELRNLAGSSLFIDNENVKVVYENVTYEYDAQAEVLEVPLAETDTHTRLKFAIVNTSEEVEVTLHAWLQSPTGSQGNPIILEELGVITAEISGADAVYYKWIATGTGTLRVTTESALGDIVVTNNTTNQTTNKRTVGDEEMPDLELEVSEGDEIVIEVNAFGGRDGENYEYDFTLLLGAAA